MTVSTFNLESFRAEVLGRSSLARVNRFEVDINAQFVPGESRLVSLYAEQANIPLLNIFTKPLKIFGPAHQRPITSEYGGEGLAMTFHVDRDMKVRRFFEDWMHKIVDPDTFTVGYQSEYATTINIRQLDDRNNVVYEVQLLEAFPRNMNIMELNNAASNQTHRLTVLFAYRYWVNLDREKAPAPAPRSVSTPQVPVREEPQPSRRQWNWSTGTLGEGPGSDLPPSA